MKLTDEIFEIEQKLLLDEERQENIVAVAAMAAGCLSLIGGSWLFVLFLEWVRR